MIKLYTFPECPFCQELKHLLNEDNIEYKDINVNLPENKIEFDNISKITNSIEVPIIRIGKQLLIPNISFQSIPEACSIVKNFLQV
jgi:glutaredoxin